MNKSVMYIGILITLSVSAGIVVGMGIGRHAGYARHLMYAERLGLQRREGGPREESREHALAVLNRSLSLSKEQTEKIGTILDSSRDNAEAIKKETFKDMEKIKEAISADIKIVLTPDQQVKFDQLMTERKEREAFGGPCLPPEGEGTFPPAP